METNNELKITDAITETPQEVEQKLIKKETSPMEGLAEKVNVMKFPFLNLVDRLSNKSLRRLIKALVLVPLEDMKVNFNVKEEKTAWSIGEELLKAKMTMIHFTLLEHEIQKEQERQRILAENPPVQTDSNVVESETSLTPVNSETKE